MLNSGPAASLGPSNVRRLATLRRRPRLAWASSPGPGARGAGAAAPHRPPGGRGVAVAGLHHPRAAAARPLAGAAAGNGSRSIARRWAKSWSACKYLEEPVLKASSTRNRRGRRLGEVLVEQGVVTHQQLYEALGLQQRMGPHACRDAAARTRRWLERREGDGDRRQQAGLQPGRARADDARVRSGLAGSVSRARGGRRLQAATSCYHLEMPGIDGAELCSRLKQGPSHAVPVMILTANDARRAAGRVCARAPTTTSTRAPRWRSWPRGSRTSSSAPTRQIGFAGCLRATSTAGSPTRLRGTSSRLGRRGDRPGRPIVRPPGDGSAGPLDGKTLVVTGTLGDRAVRRPRRRSATRAESRPDRLEEDRLPRGR